MTGEKSCLLMGSCKMWIWATVSCKTATTEELRLVLESATSKSSFLQQQQQGCNCSVCNNESEDQEPPEGPSDCGSTGSNFFPTRRSRAGPRQAGGGGPAQAALCSSAVHTHLLLLDPSLPHFFLQRLYFFTFHLELTSLQKYLKLHPKIQY